jgi:glycosyltransferase involved in cell wall biosynthesis
LLEHGTLRWTRNFLPEHQAAATEYRQKIERADMLLVTNLDEETLAIAEGIASTHWIAFPHPYDFNPRAPYPRAAALREEVLAATKSRYLILSPASINWRGDHNKGTDVGLRAFAELRRQGLQVGLVLAEWGRDLESAREFLQSNGLERYVHFTPLLSRFGLQKMMAACDVVWDQFGLDAFGALALRAMEQRVALVSKAIGPKAEQLIGKSPPYVNAHDVDSLALATEALVFASASELRDRVEAQHRWMIKKHHPALTAELAMRSFDYVLNAGPRPGADEWSRLEYNPGSRRVEEIR